MLINSDNPTRTEYRFNRRISDTPHKPWDPRTKLPTWSHIKITSAILHHVNKPCFNNYSTRQPAKSILTRQSILCMKQTMMYLYRLKKMKHFASRLPNIWFAHFALCSSRIARELVSFRCYSQVADKGTSTELTEHILQLAGVISIQNSPICSISFYLKFKIFIRIS